MKTIDSLKDLISVNRDVLNAVRELQGKKGVSLVELKKFLKNSKKMDIVKNNGLIKMALKKATDKRMLTKEGVRFKISKRALPALNDADLLVNTQQFMCPVCLLDVEAREGATLRECHHSFCKECLAGAIEYSDTAVVKCPFRNDEFSCECYLQEREVKALVIPAVYDRHLQRSLDLAESQAQDSFHCKTPDCTGWCLVENTVKRFLCPVCKLSNCLACAAIHEGKNCQQFQDEAAFRCDTSNQARKTQKYLKRIFDNGKAMRCPGCQVILMKNGGCNHMWCSMCKREFNWTTRRRRTKSRNKDDTWWMKVW